jgi:hypothetical protein
VIEKAESADKEVRGDFPDIPREAEMMKRFGTWSVLLALTLVAALAGCGGGSSSTPAPPASPSGTVQGNAR